MTSHEAGLTQVLLKLWSWSILDKRVLMATLFLLVAYTANYVPGTSHLALYPVTQPKLAYYNQPNPIHVTHTTVIKFT